VVWYFWWWEDGLAGFDLEAVAQFLFGGGNLRDVVDSRYAKPC
jgi:hypothetical protein